MRKASCLGVALWLASRGSRALVCSLWFARGGARASLRLLSFARSAGVLRAGVLRSRAPVRALWRTHTDARFGAHAVSAPLFRGPQWGCLRRTKRWVNAPPRAALIWN